MRIAADSNRQKQTSSKVNEPNMPLVNPYATRKSRRKSQFILPIVIIIILIICYYYRPSSLVQTFISNSHNNNHNRKNQNNGDKNHITIKLNDKNTPIIKDGHEQNDLIDINQSHNHRIKTAPKATEPTTISTIAKSQKAPNKDNNNHQSSTTSFIPTLRNKKIFFEVVTVGLKQFSYLEDIIDSVRDMCEAGAHVSFHITSSNCNPNNHDEKEGEECPIRNQSSEETKEDNFNVETISHLNERVRCRNPEGSLDLNIHLVSPDWG